MCKEKIMSAFLHVFCQKDPKLLQYKCITANLTEKYKEFICYKSTNVKHYLSFF